jgi:molybdate transport system substrate-binding protein
VAFNFAASGTLVRQIQEGAPADLILSADEAQLDKLAKAGLLAPGSRADLLSNTLAVVVAADSPLTVTSAVDLASPQLGKVAIGDPASVPAGAYAKAWLQGAKAWDKIIDKAVPCDSVRGVLAAVESGNVDAGIVYRTDALISKKVRVALDVPRAEGPPIRYPVAQLKDAPGGAEAGRFLGFIEGPAAAGVFKAHGFLLLSVTAGAP